MPIDISQFHEGFFEEAGEHLARMEALLLELDLVNPDEEKLNAIFRAAHSIKGGSGTFGLTAMKEFTHVLESLLDRVRRGEVNPTTAMIDTCLQAGDVLRDQLARYRARTRTTPRMRRRSRSACRRLRPRTPDVGKSPAVAAPLAQLPRTTSHLPRR